MGNSESAFPPETHGRVGIRRFMGDKCNVSFFTSIMLRLPRRRHDSVFSRTPQLLRSLLEGAIHIIFKEIVELLALPYCRRKVVFCIRDRGGQRLIFASRLFTSLMFFFGGGGPVF